MKISNTVDIGDWEIQLSAIRAQGAGGQNVNKVSTAIHLRFDIKRSSLPAFYKDKLLNLNDSRITKEGVIILKAQQYRTQELNKEDALNRLKEMILSAAKTQKARRATKPSLNARKKRMDSKSKRGQLKSLRKRVDM